MGTKSKSDISNSAIRMLLQAAGSYYDEARGFKKFNTKGEEWQKVLKLFSNSCCFCGVALTADDATNDHLIPINKTALGLHAWGNIVPCCRGCNKEKHYGDWEPFLKKKSPGKLYSRRRDVILEFQGLYKYNPNLKLQDIANNLYEDIGEVSATLIHLRLKQAQAIIGGLVGKG